ncbi:MAG: NDP-sugar pyrophosphorylase [Chloroflexi bacterium]|jgi:NDP-sugar pyrophosphorylase family protein|nr:MAG: NDP-sugar pyrophosphorylase [Chloroflexota bacterium]
MAGLAALILAGGRGERLRPYTENAPKPMVPVNGKPLIYHQLSWLQRSGVDQAYILCGYKYEVMQDYFRENAFPDMAIHFVPEDEPLGRGGAFKQGLSYIDPGVDLVIATNGDIVTDQPLEELIETHRRFGGLATIMLSPLRSSYGIVHTQDDGRVLMFQEKPILPYWVNGGIYAFSPAIKNLLPNKGDHETTTFPELARQGKLFAFKSSAMWLPVDTVKDLGEASKILADLEK